MTFGDRLKEARTRAGLSQKQLAESSHLALRTITSYENGERLPKKEETYLALAQALDIPVTSLKDTPGDGDSATEALPKSYGGHGRRKAEEIIRTFRIAAAGGELDDDDLDFIRDAMIQTYADAKNYNRRLVNNQTPSRNVKKMHDEMLNEKGKHEEDSHKDQDE